VAATEQALSRKDQMIARFRTLDRKLMTTPGVGPAWGLAKGLSVTLKHLMRRSVTQQYPRVKPDLPPRTRGIIALKEENCTVCMLCSRECPDWCIYIDSHKEVMPPKEPGARSRTRNVLDRFAIDYALCMYCGICVEVCPFDALFWAPHFEYSVTEIGELTHEMDTLGKWMDYVKVPPPLEAGAEEPKELAAEAKEVAVAEARAQVPGAVAAGTAPVAAAPAQTAPAMQPSPAPGAPAETPEAPAPSEAQVGAGAPTAAAPAPGGTTAADDHEPPEIDEETYQRELAAGKPERVARALAKRASIIKRRQAGG
jgi:NADH-quinone oxidoreductase subunit I